MAEKVLVKVRGIARQTGKAVLAHTFADETAWLPKSQIEVTSVRPEDPAERKTYILMPQWLYLKCEAELDVATRDEAAADGIPYPGPSGRWEKRGGEWYYVDYRRNK